MRISHSSKETYLTCGQKWKLRYQDKLRPKTVSSALVFGSAIDEAFNHILLKKKKILTKKEKLNLANFTAAEIFERKITKGLINDEPVNFEEKPDLIEYYKSDFDAEIFQKTFKYLYDSECLEEDIPYSQKCWLTLYGKGLMIVDAYEKEILPLIEEIYSIQEKVELVDGDDIFVGYIDFVASFKDEPDVRYICDNKTSSRPYSTDSVKNSDQLASYAEYLGIKRAAYIVAEKKIRKKEPRVRINVIRDIISEEQLNITFDKISEAFYAITHDENFEKNFDSCFTFGKKCEYYNYCRTGSLKNLVYKERRG